MSNPNGTVLVTNVKNKLRDGFVLAAPDTDVWQVENNSLDLIDKGGDAVGSAYLRIVKDIRSIGSDLTLTTKKSYAFPIRIGAGVTLSQRIVGQEFYVGISGAQEGNIAKIPARPDIAISGTISVTSNVATINTTVPHNLKGDDRIVLVGCADSRLNVGPVLVTIVTPTQITVPLTIANGTYTATNGVLRWADPVGMAQNSAGLLYENATATNASWVTRRNGASARMIRNQTVVTTAATQSNTSPFTDAWNAGNETEIIAGIEDVSVTSRTPDGVVAASNIYRWSQGIPDEDTTAYAIAFRAKNLDNMTAPVAKIVNAVKTGTTVATITTDVPHGLNALDWVQIYGIRDITNFPNLTAQTQVTSIVDATNFTIVIGGAVTATSNGGFVSRVQGSVTQPGALNFSIQSLASTTNEILTITLNTTAAGLLPGEYCQILGLDPLYANFEGKYKVLRLTGSTVEVYVKGLQTFGSVNTGGGIVKNTEMRIHFARCLDYTREIVEMATARGAADSSRSLPVNITTGTIATVSTVSTVTTVTTLSTLTGGAAAEDAATTSNPLIVGGVVRTATSPTTLIAGDAARNTMTSSGALVNFPYAVPETTLPFNLSLTTTTAQAARAVGAAGIRNYLVGLQVYNSGASAVDVIVLDGATEIWRQTVNATSGREFVFDIPLRTAAATALNVNLSAVGTVRVTGQTFQAA